MGLRRNNSLGRFICSEYVNISPTEPTFDDFGCVLKSGMPQNDYFNEDNCDYPVDLSGIWLTVVVTSVFLHTSYGTSALATSHEHN
jgi:hypothetical protein